MDKKEVVSRRFNFTVKRIEKLPPNDRNSKSTDQEYSDSEVPGLKLFVSKSARKSFHFRYIFNRRKRVIKIADFNCLSLPEVREVARKYRGMVSQNVNPLTERDKSLDVPDFKTFSVAYMDWCRSHKRSWKDDRNKIMADLNPTFGNDLLAEITSKKIMDFLEVIKTRNSSAFSNRYRSLLSKMFSLAKQWGVINCDNPCSRIPKYPESSGRNRFLNGEEIQRFLSALDGYQGRSVTALLLKFLLYSGLRLGEAKCLKWTDICDSGQIHIRMENAKNKKSRYIESNPLILSVLRELEVHRSPKNPYIFPGAIPGSHLSNPNKLFKTVKSKADLDDICIHSLRHTFASLSIAAGTNLYVVQSQLGHASYKTTQRYAHISQEAIRAASNGVAREINKAIGG